MEMIMKTEFHAQGLMKEWPKAQTKKKATFCNKGKYDDGRSSDVG